MVGRRNRLKRNNSNDSDWSNGSGGDNHHHHHNNNNNNQQFNYSSNVHHSPMSFYNKKKSTTSGRYIEPPTYNQPAYSYQKQQQKQQALDRSARSNHSRSSSDEEDMDGSSHHKANNLNNTSRHKHHHKAAPKPLPLPTTDAMRFPNHSQIRAKLEQQVTQQYQAKSKSKSAPSTPTGGTTQKKKGLRRLLASSSSRSHKTDNSVKSGVSSSSGGGIFRRRFRRKNPNDSDTDYQSDTNYSYNHHNHNNNHNNNRSRKNSTSESLTHDNSNNDFFDFDPSQSYNPNESEYGYSDRDESLRSYEVPVNDDDDQDDDQDGSGSNMVRRRRNKSQKIKSKAAAAIQHANRKSMNQDDHLQLNNFDPGSSSGEEDGGNYNGSSSDGQSFGGDSYYSESYSDNYNDNNNDETDSHSGEFPLDMSDRSHAAPNGAGPGSGGLDKSYNSAMHPPPPNVDYSLVNRHQKDLASQNLQAIESMARKAGPNHADEAFLIMPDHSYPDTKMNRKQLRKEMNMRSAYYHDLRMPRSSHQSKKQLGKLRVEVLQCFGLPTTSLVREVSAYAVAVMGNAAFQTDIIPNVANPMWLSKMRRACLFGVETMYSQFSIGIFDLEAIYADPNTIIGHPGHPGWTPPEERTGFGFHRSSSLSGMGHNSMTSNRSSSASFGFGNENRRGSSGPFTMNESRRGSGFVESLVAGARRQGSANGSMHFTVDDDEADGKPPTDRQPNDFCTKAEDFIGHVTIDICRLRPGCTYDVTLPLRRSKHVFTREPQGSVRVRLHLEWTSERNAVMSYLPRSLGGTVSLQKQPNTRHTVNCVDDRSARNVAHAVHGIHMPGKFDMTLLKSTLREIHWTRIHLLRYCKNREIYHLCYWVYPSISGFLFLAWMHAVYFDTVRYVPGHVVVFGLLHLMKNYAYYAMDSPLQNGFLAPTLEELYWALVSGTKKRKKPCIESLTVEREADPMALTASDHARIHPGGIGSMMNNARHNNMDELYDENGNLVHVTRFPLSEIADAMKKSLKVRSYRKGFTVFKHTFQGDDAVDFLLIKGFAMTRPEAVSVGRRLEREKKLFQHINKDSLFEDSNLIYCFLDNSETDRYLSQTSHVPAGARLLELLGFYTREKKTKGGKKQKKRLSMTGGADILESRDHVEFPFATGTDHPRFTVKESLVIRSGEEKTRLNKESEARSMAEAAEFGIVLSSRNLFAPHGHKRPSASGYDSEGGQRHLMGRRGSAIGTAISSGANAMMGGQYPRAASLMGGGHGHPHRNSLSGSNEFEVAATGESAFNKLKEQGNATLNKVLELQQKADEYDPYQYDSDGDVKTIQKKKRKKHFILEKHLKKPASQEIGNIASTTVDMSLAKSLEQTKRHVNAIFYHMFDDPVYKIDRNIFPIKQENKNESLDKKKKKKRSLFNRRAMEEEQKEEEERQRMLQMTPYEKQQEDLDKILLINQYSHWNPWINRIAVVMQPLLEMAQTFLFFFRALFNLFTWQDPVLCFWLCFVGPPLALILYVCPYRIVSFFLGIYWIGPQNYLLRVYRESKEGYEPPNFDLIVKKKKFEKPGDFGEMQFFSSEAPGNQQIRFRNIDPAKVKQIVVPSNVMMYGNRFYDWPPEPKYARVYASEAPSNLITPGFADDGTAGGYESTDSTFVFDQAARMKSEEEREKMILKKKRKKGVGKKITAGIKKTTHATGGVIMTGTEKVGGVTVGAVKGTAQITKTVVLGTGKQAKSAAKGTGNFLRLRKRNQKKFKPSKYYSDEEDEYY